MEIQTQPFSPWLSIWIKPRGTIRKIVEANSSKHVIILAMLAGIAQALDRASSQNMGDALPVLVILAVCIIFAPLGGLISVNIGGALLSWTGGWLGGKASFEQVRTAIAWSYVPTIFIMPLWIPKLLIFREELFTSATPRIDANPLLAILMLGFIAIEIAVGVWAIVVFLKCLSEVHQFAAWKALATSILGTLVVVGPILCIVGALIGLSRLGG